MKLINYINIRFMLVLLVIFTLAGVGMYIKLGFDVDENIDEILTARMDKINENMARHPESSFVGFSADQSIQISEVMPCKPSKYFSDTIVLNLHDNRYDQCRKITQTQQLKGRFYKIQITYSRFETEDMVEILFSFMIGLFVLIVALLYFLNYRLSKLVWKQFFSTINKLRQFKIGQPDKVEFDKVDIHEFNQLNTVLTEMIDKIQSDFSNLKEFTENASHEIQTPLAIIKSKLEIVLQNDSLAPDVLQSVQLAYKTVARLSKLNEGLVMLSRIENRQFVELAEVDLCLIVHARLEIIEDLLALKSIQLEVQLNEPVVCRMNPVLADVLISNLLNNALKHNLPNGKISIVSSPGELVFSNSGQPLTIHPDKLFQRFSKNTASGDSTGLGLAIVSEICKLYGISIQYSYANAEHSIKLNF